jgi:hypothetical protein
MKKASIAQFCITVGGLGLLAGALANNFLDVSDSVTDSLTFGGIVLMLVGLWLARKDKQATLSTRDKRKKFLLLSVAVLVGAVVAFFGIRRKFLDFSVAFQLGISVFTFLICMSYFYWDLFMRREK